jgi:hypothetical protein
MVNKRTVELAFFIRFQDKDRAKVPDYIGGFEARGQGRAAGIFQPLLA